MLFWDRAGGFSGTLMILSGCGKRDDGNAQGCAGRTIDTGCPYGRGEVDRRRLAGRFEVSLHRCPAVGWFGMKRATTGEDQTALSGNHRTANGWRGVAPGSGNVREDLPGECGGDGPVQDRGRAGPRPQRPLAGADRLSPRGSYRENRHRAGVVEESRGSRSNSRESAAGRRSRTGVYCLRKNGQEWTALFSAQTITVGGSGTDHFRDRRHRPQAGRRSMHKAYDELEIRVEERTADLRKAYERLKEETAQREQVEAISARRKRWRPSARSQEALPTISTIF